MHGCLRVKSLTSITTWKLKNLIQNKRKRRMLTNHIQMRASPSTVKTTAMMMMMMVNEVVFWEFVQVYQSLDRELQRHVSLRDTLQQCQTWLYNIQEELQPPAQTPRYLEEALIQVHTSQTQFDIFFPTHI